MKAFDWVLLTILSSVIGYWIYKGMDDVANAGVVDHTGNGAVNGTGSA